MPDSESVATKAARRAMAFQERIKDRLRKEFAAAAGEEVVGARELRGQARRAWDGDDGALRELQALAGENGHQAGEPVPCAVCRQVNYVLNERAAGNADREVPLARS